MASVHSSSYGESRLRMLRVLHRGDRHDPKDLTIGIRFEGPFEAVIPGEALKNLVHRVVREQEHAKHRGDQIERCVVESEILPVHHVRFEVRDVFA